MDVKITIKNLPQIRAAFSQAPRLMNQYLAQALAKAAATVQRESMINAPVLTGFLRASHTMSVTGSGLAMKAEIGPTANYAIFVHEGTRFMKGRPFLKQGVEQAKDDVQGYFKEAVQEVFNKIGRSV